MADAKNNLTTYEYDGFDRLLKLRYPSPTTPGTSSTTDYAQYSYDAASNLIQTRRRDGTVIGLSHDALNRVTLKDLPGGEPDVSYAYDNLSRATAASSNVATLGFAYDQLGRLTRQTSPQGDTDYRYDLANRRTRLTWPDGFYVSYEYLVAGEMAAIRENGSALLASFSHDDAGRRTALARGNGTTTSYCYGGVTTQPGCTSTGGGASLTGLVQDLAGTPSDQSQGFAYNPAAQIVQQTRSNDAYGRDHLRALTQRVEVTDREVRIIGSHSHLPRTSPFQAKGNRRLPTCPPLFRSGGDGGCRARNLSY